MIRRSTLCVIGLLLFFASTVKADSPVPLNDFSKISKNGKYIFVLIANGDDPSNYNPMGQVWKKDELLRQKYPVSGLYLNDGSTTPLWTVDWNTDDYSLEVSSDGRHVVRVGPWPFQGQYQEDALSFYEDGQLIKKYLVQDLVALPGFLPKTVSHYMWLNEKVLDDDQGLLSIETKNGEKYTFELASGKIVEGHSLQLFLEIPLYFIGIMLVGGALLVWMYFRKARQ
jgi:hypothetical protein